MKSISCLFTNAVILTMDESMNLYEPGALAIENNLIIDVGLNDEIVQKYTSPQVIDCMGKVLMPGLIMPIPMLQ
jgi:5-methylthioadenosine/S-adenosylhomocysteine deaminase